MSSTSALSASARRALRAAAHHLDPVVMIGQHGLTAAVLHEIDLALTAHALIKVRVQSDERETREAYLAEICAKLGCENVQHLGKLLVLWRNAGDASADESGDEAAARPRSPARGPRRGLASAPPARDSERAPRARGARGDDFDERRAPSRPRAAPRSREGGASDDFAPPRRRSPEGGGARSYGERGGYGQRGSDGRRRDDDAAPRARWGSRRDEAGGDGQARGYVRRGTAPVDDRGDAAPRGRFAGRSGGQFDDRQGERGAPPPRGRARAGAATGGFERDRPPGNSRRARGTPGAASGGAGRGEYAPRDTRRGSAGGFNRRGDAPAATAPKPRTRRRLG
ncbi:MAG: YhbY family RNA-binding protein [Proteobacteria bacterium]|nr:YhbY family RNA-binding protein [Pseudomonadota bacterium]